MTMLKRIVIFLALALPFMANAQYGVGDWRIHTIFVGSAAERVIDTPDKVYYLVSNNLFCYDKETEENEAYNKRNYLSDVTISQIYYNYEKKYLLVAYVNSNIDIILDSGKVVNLPDIKNAVMTQSKTINHVNFAKDKAFVATNFGYVVINDVKMEMQESRVFNTPIYSVAQVGDVMLISANKLYYGLASDYHETLASYKSTSNSNSKLIPLNDNKFFYITGWFYVFTINKDDSGNISFSSTQIAQAAPKDVQPTPTGFIANFKDAGYYYTFDAEGNNATKVTATKELFSCHPRGDGTMWAVGANGLHRAGDQANYFKPNGIQFANPFHIAYNSLSKKAYVATTATNAFFATNTATAISSYDGTTWENVTPTTNYSSGSFHMVFDPEIEDTYYLSTWTKGLAKIKGREVVRAYNATNTPMVARSGAMHPIHAFDRYGNLWVCQSYENPDHPVMVVPRAKLLKSNTTASDWYTPNVPTVDQGSTKRASFVVTKNNTSDVKVFNSGDFQRAFVFWKNENGNISNANPPYRTYTSFHDQDEKGFEWTYVLCMTEDLDGRVWVGCVQGIFSFDPAQAFDDSFRINHTKVPRNDGTDLADYLLDGIQVNCIAVDGANRKWIGTNESGLFLVSPDGSQILKQFNTGNSYLSSNTIYNVCCNTDNNSVYIITPTGVYEYFSDSTPAEPDYSNVYAYPNPVRPDFTGLVTIKGLMDNSLLKITDAGGNVVKQLRSTGGMATWDCCGDNGERVKTGVYYVMASQAQGGKQASVTKLVIIK